jgi:pyridoxine/pyridoxamine 5'-phosphate oxidase
MGTTSNYALRLPASLKTAAEEVAREDGATLNQFIVTAVAEKLSAMKTAAYFKERAAKGDLAAFDRFISRKSGEPPQDGDRLP